MIKYEPDQLYVVVPLNNTITIEIQLAKDERELGELAEEVLYYYCRSRLSEMFQMDLEEVKEGANKILQEVRERVIFRLLVDAGSWV